MKREYAKYILNKTKEDYSLIADDFSRTRSFAWDELKLLVQYITPDDKVLDLGCGNGRLLQIFEDQDIEYIGIDNSEKLIKIAKEKYPQKNFQVADALNLPFPDNCFDKIYSVAVLHHIPSIELRFQFLKEAKRTLRPGGLLVLTVWNLWQRKTAWKLLIKTTILKLLRKSQLDFRDIFYPWKNSGKEIIAQRYFHLFTQKELKKLFKKAGFKIKEIGILEKKRKEKKWTNIYLIAEKP